MVAVRARRDPGLDRRRRLRSATGRPGRDRGAARSRRRDLPARRGDRPCRRRVRRPDARPLRVVTRPGRGGPRDRPRPGRVARARPPVRAGGRDRDPDPVLPAVPRGGRSAGAPGDPERLDPHRARLGARPRPPRRVRAAPAGRRGAAGEPAQPHRSGVAPRRAGGPRRAGTRPRPRGGQRRDPRRAGARPPPAHPVRIALAGDRGTDDHPHLHVEELQPAGSPHGGDAPRRRSGARTGAEDPPDADRDGGQPRHRRDAGGLA